MGECTIFVWVWPLPADYAALVARNAITCARDVQYVAYRSVQSGPRSWNVLL